DPMAVRAPALALEERLAALGVAREPGLVVRPCVVTHEQHDLLDLVLVEICGAHLGPRDPVHDVLRALESAQGAPAPHAAEVDPFDGVAALAVTRGAGGLVDAQRVLGLEHMLRGGRSRGACGQNAYGREGSTEENATHRRTQREVLADGTASRRRRQRLPRSAAAAAGRERFASAAGRT